MRPRSSLPANLATTANALVGVGAILYALAGNKLWAMLLIVCGLGFDGLDGLLHRRSQRPSNLFGRVADSVADAITFGLAPAALLVVHTDHSNLWAPDARAEIAVAALWVALSVARLVYFTVKAHHLPHFLGAPTPQSAIALVVLLLFADVPAILGTNPAAVLIGASVIALLMIAPFRFPKIRRGAPLRPAMTVTAVALVGAILPFQFRPSTGSPPFEAAVIATIVAAVGIAAYYVIGPFTVAPIESSG